MHVVFSSGKVALRISRKVLASSTDKSNSFPPASITTFLIFAIWHLHKFVRTITTTCTGLVTLEANPERPYITLRGSTAGDDGVMS
jgi:hypothetical protein